MQKAVWLILLLLACLFFYGCASTTVSGTWRNPEFSGGKLKTVMVVGVAKEELVRRLFEDGFVAELAKMGAEGIVSYKQFTPADLDDQKKVLARLTEQGIDAVLVTSKINRRTEQVVTPGRSYATGYSPYPYHRHGWGGYYRHSYEIVHQPATVSHVEVVTMESNLYTRAGELVWSAQTETVVDGTAKTLVREFVTTVSADLAGQKIF